MTSDDWNDGIRRLVGKLTSFSKESESKCYHFMVNNQLIGYIRESVLKILRVEYSSYFLVDDERKRVHIQKSHDIDYESRTRLFDEVLQDMRKKDLFAVLRGWRNEKYNISCRFYDQKLFRMERSALPIFGFISYGCHINGYVKGDDGVYKMWLSRRSPTKQTFPGMLDNLAAGGFAADYTLFENAIKELDEESSISGDLLCTLKSVDAVMYAYENEEGIHREGEFIFDIKLPEAFVPKNKDGEVDQFYLMTIDEVKKAVIRDDFKPNCALITLNFLIRKGLISPDTDQNYFYLLENMHSTGF